MTLPDRLAYLQDVAIGEAKRRGHAEVDLAHLGVAALRLEEGTVREVLGRDAAEMLERHLGRNREEFGTPQPHRRRRGGPARRRRGRRGPSGRW